MIKNHIETEYPETHDDVQITLDAQETTRFKQHPPSLRAQEKMEIRVYGRDVCLERRSKPTLSMKNRPAR